jgi:hypothetical protein
MRKSIWVMSVGLMLLTSCADDKLKVINNTDRVNDLEARVSLLEQVVATKASADDVAELQSVVFGRLVELEEDLGSIQSDYLTSEDGEQLVSLGEQAYWDLRGRLGSLRHRVNGLENDIGDVDERLDLLIAEVAAIQPVINNDNSVTFNVNINFSSLFGSITYNVTNITQENADLALINDRLDDLESAVFENNLGTLQAQIALLQAQILTLQEQPSSLVLSSQGISTVSCSQALSDGFCACTTTTPNSNNRSTICAALGLPSSCAVQFGGTNPNQAGVICANVCQGSGNSLKPSCVK